MNFPRAHDESKPLRLEALALLVSAVLARSMSDPAAHDQVEVAGADAPERHRSWWARRVLRVSQRVPRLGMTLERLGVLLLITWPFLLALSGLLIARWIPADLTRRLDDLDDRYPFLSLLFMVALVFFVMQSASSVFFKLGYLGRQLKAVQHGSSLQGSHSPPVVYLRPFGADETNRIPFRARMAVVGANVLANIEEQLADVVRPIGPLVAVGVPSEELPTPGAARRYFDDSQWRSAVDELVRQARLVIIRPGLSEGLRWELDEVLSTTPPARVLILAVDQRAREYSAFSAMLKDQFDVRLPDFKSVSRWRRVSGFFEFGPAWEARFLPLKAPWLRDSKWTPMKARLNHALKPVFARLGVEWHPSPISEWNVLMAVVGALGLLFGLLAYFLG